jgi:adenylate kinase
VYEAQTKPVVDFYERKGLVRRVDGVGSIDEITARLTEAAR